MKRFWDKVKQGPGCWEWMGCTNYVRGYGVFKFLGKNCMAHRMAWNLHYGDIPEGMSVLHHCDNSKCVNPDHLFLGTQCDNLRDMEVKGRGYGSKLTESDALNIRILDIPRINLAKLYGVSRTTIRDIKTRHTWKHLA